MMDTPTNLEKVFVHSLLFTPVHFHLIHNSKHFHLSWITPSATAPNSTMAPRIDYKKVLTSWSQQHNLDLDVSLLISKNKGKGKEPKLCLLLAKQYGRPNPLNEIFQTRLQNIDATNIRKQIELYLSVFYPSNLGEVDNLMNQYQGRENELISKLQSNFHACGTTKDQASEVDYQAILTKFLTKADPERVSEVDSILEKCKGRETILFSVLSKEYKLPNPLNDVFVRRVKSIDSSDYTALIRLYLSVFNPRVAYRGEAFARQYEGNEAELFAKLSEKFHAVNPLEIKGTIRQHESLKSPVKPISTVDGCVDSNDIIQSPGILA